MNVIVDGNVVARGRLAPLCMLAAALAAACLPAWELSAAQSFALVTNGAPAAVLLAPPGAEEAAGFFASEAAKCLKGQKFAVVTKRPDAGNCIAFKVRDASYEKEDAYRITFPDGRTMQIECTGVSARWAVNWLLTKGLGIVYLSPCSLPDGGSFDEYPSVAWASLPAEPVVQRAMPYWSLRSLDYRSLSWNSSIGAKGIRPPHRVLIDAFDMYGHAEKGDWQDAMLPTYSGVKYRPPAVPAPLPNNPFRAIRALEKACGRDWNPCFGNPESAAIAISNLVALLAREPARRTVQLDICDNGGLCECETCRRLNGDKMTSTHNRDAGGSYWRWVNAVAEGVSKVRPDVFFVTLAYREVDEPPPFKLHPRVLVRVCFELAELLDEDVARKRRDLMQRWADVASIVEMYDYCYGLRRYCLPRNYISKHGGWLSEFHDLYKVSGCYAESGGTMTSPFDGPKYCVMSEALRGNWDDPWGLVANWCRAAVGPAAAKPLMEYYRFWDRFWSSDEIRRTPWFRHTVSHTYLGLGGTAYVAALKPGDMAHCRSLVDNVVALADTPDRRRRARAIEMSFRIAEDSASALFSDFIRPEGNVASAEDAVGLIRALPSAVRALERLKGNFYAPQMQPGSVEAGQLCNFSLVLPYIGDNRVKAAMEACVADESVPVLFRAMMKIWGGARVTNLLSNGSFEDSSPLPTGWNGGRLIARRMDVAASDGRFSLGGRNFLAEVSLPVEQGHSYLFLFDAMSPTGSAEGRFHWRVSPWRRSSPVTHFHGRDLVLPAGIWQHYAVAVTVKDPNAVSIRANFNSAKYEPDELVLLDNVRVYDLEEVSLSRNTVSQ